MSELIIFLSVILLLLVVGFGFTWAVTHLNRYDIALEEKARTIIREKMAQSVSPYSLEIFVSNNISKEYQEKAKFLLKEISKYLDIPVDSLTFDTKLSHIFRVHISEMDSVNRHNQKNRQYVEPFTYDLLYILEKFSDQKSWRNYWRDNPNLPRNEEALADFVMELTPAQLVILFAPLIREEFSDTSCPKSE